MKNKKIISLPTLVLLMILGVFFVFASITHWAHNAEAEIQPDTPITPVKLETKTDVKKNRMESAGPGRRQTSRQRDSSICRYGCK